MEISITQNELEIVRKVVLHHGFDSIKDEPKDSSIFTEFLRSKKDYSIVETTTPMERELRMDLVTSTSDLAKKINAQGEASISLGIFKGKGKLSFLKDVKFNDKNFYLLVTSKIISRIEKLYNIPGENEIFENINEDYNKESFVNRFGDKYINQISYGGELYILFELEASSKEEKEEWKGQIEVKVGPFSGSVDFQHRVENFSETINKNIKIIENGNSRIENINLLDIESLINKANNFYSSVDNNSGYIIGFSTANYNSIGPSFNALNPIYSLHFSELKNKLYGLYQKLLKVRNNLELLQDGNNFLLSTTQSDETEVTLNKIEDFLTKTRILYKKFYLVKISMSLEELFEISGNLIRDANDFIYRLPKQKFFINKTFSIVNKTNYKVENSQSLNFDDRLIFNPLIDYPKLKLQNVKLQTIFIHAAGNPENGDYATGQHGYLDFLRRGLINAISFRYVLSNGELFDTDIYGSHLKNANNDMADLYRIYEIDLSAIHPTSLRNVKISVAKKKDEESYGITAISFFDRNNESISNWSTSFRDRYTQDEVMNKNYFVPKKNLNFFGFYGTYTLNRSEKFVIKELFPIWKDNTH